MFIFSEYRAATYLLAFGLGWLLTYLLTPAVRATAIGIGFVDNPGGRKKQAKPVALGGGLAVFGGALGAILCAYLFADWSMPKTFVGNDARLLTGLAVAALATLLMGMYDDAADLRGRYKLLGQLLIAGMLIYLGFRIEHIGFMGTDFQLGWLIIPASLFWLVGAMNSINLLDGIDGLASGIGVVLCLTFAAINAMYGRFPEAVVTLAMAGALIGFLRYNFAPASIYLGDAGSMVIGLVIGAIAVQTHMKTPAFIALTIPLAAWAIPILDSGAAIVRRKLTGQSLFAPDRGHLHHSLLTRGWTVRQASTFIALICATTCLSAVLGVLWQNEWIVIGTVVAVVIFLISSRTFGHIEFALLKHRVSQHGLHFRRGDAQDHVARHGTVRLQGSHDWDEMWDSLVESASDYGLSRMKLTINMPAVHEAFYADWKAPKIQRPPADTLWRVSHPLMIGEEIVGKFEVVGVSDDSERSTLSQMIQVLDFLEPIEENIRSVKELLTPSRPSPAVAESGDSSAEPLPGGADTPQRTTRHSPPTETSLIFGSQDSRQAGAQGITMPSSLLLSCSLFLVDFSSCHD